jgi:hypothetical protein
VIKGDKLIVGLTIIVMISVAGWQALVADKESSRSNMLPEMSSLSALPTGSKAAFLVLEDLGAKPIRFGRSFAQLRGRKGTLITYGTAYDNFMPTPIDSLEAESLKEWIAEGNTVLAFGDAAEVAFETGVVENSEAEIGAGKGRLEGLRITGCHASFDEIEKADEVIIESKSGVFAVERSIGNGKAFLFARPYVVSNEMLGETDNAAILTLASKENSVFFDDFHRGHVSGGSPLEMLPSPIRTAVLLCLLIGAVWVFKSTFHFGPLRDGEARTIRSGAEIAWSLSRLLRQAGAANTAAREMVRAFKTEMAIPQDAPLETAVDRLSGDNIELRENAHELGSLVERGGMGSKQLAGLASTLSDIRRLAKDQAKGIHTTK